MKRSILAVSVLALLATACRPPVSIRQESEIVNLSGETETKGDDVFIWIRVAAKEGDSTWKVTFIHDTPEQLTVDKVVSTTNIRWKVSADRRKALTVFRLNPIGLPNVAPYQLMLTSTEGQTTHVSIRFLSEARGIGLSTLPGMWL